MPPESAGPPAVEDERSQEARRLFLAGRAAYERADYEAAIALFRASYELVPAPALLFNVAQAMRLAGRCTDSLEYYEAFRGRGTALPSDFEQLHQQAVACSGDAPKPEVAPAVAPSAPAKTPDAVANESPATAEVVPQKPVPTSKPEPTDERSSRDWWGVGCIGVSLGSAIAGTAFAFSAAAAADETSELSRTSGATWDSDAQESERRGKVATVWATGLFATSALTAGAGLWLLLGSDESTPYRATVTAHETGLAATLGGQF